MGYSGLGYSRGYYGGLGYGGYGYSRLGGYYGKREAEAEPKADADAEADPYYGYGYSGLGYSGLRSYGGYGLGYSRGYSTLGYSGLGYSRGLRRTRLWLRPWLRIPRIRRSLCYNLQRLSRPAWSRTISVECLNWQCQCSQIPDCR